MYKETFPLLKNLTIEQQPITGTPAHKFLSPIEPKLRTFKNEY